MMCLLLDVQLHIHIAPVSYTHLDVYKRQQLHWLIADREGAITVESVRAGLRIYENPVGVLTNNPPFEQQMFCLLYTSRCV